MSKYEQLRNFAELINFSLDATRKRLAELETRLEVLERQVDQNEHNVEIELNNVSHQIPALKEEVFEEIKDISNQFLADITATNEEDGYTVTVTPPEEFMGKLDQAMDREIRKENKS